MSDILQRAKQIEADIIAFRRELHRQPELSGQEFETQKKIEAELDKLGIPYRRVGRTSLIASIYGEKSRSDEMQATDGDTAATDGDTAKTGSRVVALRADFDALPIHEETQVDFASEKPGIMHACGHDAHTAMLLGAARILTELKKQFDGEIRLFFQEGEENFTGAKQIVEAGGMEGVEGVFAMHGMNNLKTGQVSINPGYRLSGSDFIHVKFEGVSGHGATPHLAKDTIHPAALFVTDLQAIVAKHTNALDPLVLSVGRFHGGTQANIVSKYTELDISMRYFSPAVRETAHQAIRRHAEAIAAMYEISVTVDIETGTYSTFNDDAITAIAAASADEVFGPDQNVTLPQAMNSEDFSYYLQKSPGVYAFIGYYNEDEGSIYAPHHEQFKLDEGYFKYGTALFATFSLKFLNQWKVSHYAKRTLT